MKVRINTIYPTFMGEQNPFGIGASVIFVRTAGCHLRCYNKTLGILCDTPEALEKDSGDEMEVSEAMESIDKLSKEMGGVRLICLTGGDPLWQHKDALHEFFTEMIMRNYKVCVETSGTISWLPFTKYPISWIVDYKTKSAGVDSKNLVFELQEYLKVSDYIKFVIKDQEDYDEMKEVLSKIVYAQISAKIVVGPYWGGYYTVFDLFRKLKEDKLLGRVEMNMQAHKMDFASAETARTVIIPREV